MVWEAGQQQDRRIMSQLGEEAGSETASIGLVGVRVHDAGLNQISPGKTYFQY